MKNLMALFIAVISITGLRAQTTIYSTNFGTSGSALPASWTKVLISGVANTVNQVGVNSTNPSANYTGASASLNLVDGLVASALVGSVAVVYNNTGTPVNTTGYTSVDIRFGAYKNGYVGTVSLEWSTDAVAWNSLISNITLPANAAWYGYGPVSLPAGALNQTNLRFRFVFNRTAASSTASTTNNFRIDDFTVTGNVGTSGGGGGGASNLWTDGGSGTIYTTSQSGKVGINNTLPTVALDVTGKAKISMDAIINTMTVGLGASSVPTNMALGHYALPVNTTGYVNIAIGDSTLAINTAGAGNVAIGASSQAAGYNSGNNNVSIGQLALRTVSGNTYNTVAIGTGAGYSGPTIGSTAIGMFSQRYSTASGNTSVGYTSLGSATTGYNNVAVGWGAGFGITTGIANTAMGINSMGTGSLLGTPGITSSANCAYGINTLFYNKSGSGNVAMGNYALFNYTGATGYNIAIGYNAGLNLTTGNYNVIIGGNDGSTIAAKNNHILLADGAGTERMRIDNTGNVGIGTTNINDVNYKLFVETGIRTRKLKVDAPAIVWPDYVFHNTYKIPSLREVEQFIEKNNHLPDMPSAAEVEKNGVDLGETQALLLKKIEELTVYMIALDKKVEKLTAENEALKKGLKKNDK